MRPFAFPFRQLGLSALLVLGCYGLLPPAVAQTSPPSPADNKVYTYADEMPQLPGGGSTEAIADAAQRLLVLPTNVQVPADSRVYVQVIVGKKGEIESASIVQSQGRSFDEAALSAIHRLPRLSPGQQVGQPVRVALNIALTLSSFTNDPTPNPADQRREAQTLKQGLAQRLPGEADTTFLRRVLPVSFPNSGNLLAATWRLSAFGKQLFFSVRGTEDSNNDGGTDLFMLDPFQANTYAVQVFTIPSQGDLTGLEAFFFADVDQDGQKELLAISECSLRESFKDHGEVLYGRAPHYQTVVFQYTGLSSAGRPQYRDYPKDTSYLDELPTAAAVRQALARHQQRSKAPVRQPAAKAVKK